MPASALSLICSAATGNTDAVIVDDDVPADLLAALRAITDPGSVALSDLTRVRETGAVIKSKCSSSAPPGYRFPREVIAVAVRWYLRYGLSYRDVEELLAERGIEVDHVTVYRWV